MWKRFWNHKAVHVTVILIVFSVTGTTVARISAYLSSLAGLEKYSWQWWLFLLVAMFPVYQVVLLVVAFIFGKFRFFLNKQKRMYRWIGRKLGVSKTEEKSEEDAPDPEG